jgi:hypothetical protein
MPRTALLRYTSITRQSGGGQGRRDRAADRDRADGDHGDPATGRAEPADQPRGGRADPWLDRGRHGACTRSRRHYLVGLHAARDGGYVVGANIISCIAYMRTSASSVRDGRLLSAAAIRGAAGRVSPLAAALLHERLAYVSAHAGDAAETAHALGPVDDLVEAGQAARQDQPGWTYWLQHWAPPRERAVLVVPRRGPPARRAAARGRRRGRHRSRLRGRDRLRGRVTARITGLYRVPGLAGQPLDLGLMPLAASPALRRFIVPVSQTARECRLGRTRASVAQAAVMSEPRCASPIVTAWPRQGCDGVTLSR